MLIGQYSGKVSAKYQIAFPKKFREFLGDELIVSQGFEGSLLVVSEKNWRTLIETAQDHPLTQANARDTKRFLLGTAAHISLDEKGRFIVPEHLRIYSNLMQDVVFLGQDTYVELWDALRWQAYNQKLIDHISIVAETLTQSPARKGMGNESHD
jgi:MraZ protein